MKRIFLTSTVEWPGVAKSIFARLGNKKIRMPFIYTPAEVQEDDMSWLEGERQMLRDTGFDIFDYTITGKNTASFHKELDDADALYISGGNEFYFKYQCNLTGFGDYILESINQDRPYIGSSAGSMILAPNMSPAINITDTNIPNVSITDHTGLGIVDFLIMPHWGSKEFKDLYLGERKNKMYEANARLILLNNYQYVEIMGDKYRIIDVRRES